MPDSFIPHESNYYYVLLTIYYVHKHMKDLVSLNLSGVMEKWELFASNRLPSDSGEGVILPGQDETHLVHKVRDLCRAAKVASAAKLTSKCRYEADDEIFDRLALLGPELDFTETGDTPIKRLSMERIRQRSFTMTVNPRWRERYDNRATTAPWEVYALCHHSRLMVMSLEMGDSEDGVPVNYKVEKFDELKTRLCHFLNTEGTVVPCWERAYSNARRGWLRSETTAVVASKLVDMNEKIMRLTAAGNVRAKEPTSRRAREDTSVFDETSQAGIRPGSSQQSLKSIERGPGDMVKDLHEIRDSWRYALHKIENLEAARAQQA
ncbi:hypothetical protein CONLIGDRAFT_684081 [Coniochaeta ligniaria NRRL 30616]|uniref:Uncharacterized protein n=1 Tax=Coniochaeta ligniaria NRRL 30616 TaxID=1408157 RepID=A0A1J7ICT6_9PEZI|nr:hypothetical protein CONLIGDRAFT_684081 [Coniochaeta ligniaria NRRL 30616]